MKVQVANKLQRPMTGRADRNYRMPMGRMGSFENSKKDIVRNLFINPTSINSFIVE